LRNNIPLKAVRKSYSNTLNEDDDVDSDNEDVNNAKDFLLKSLVKALKRLPKRK
jgi:hypothetical protein